MSSSYISEDTTINISTKCKFDSNVGYEADFTVNGEHDGWEYYDGIHTFGVWGGFIFGTLYGDYGTIGRYSVFPSVDATYYYTVRLVMKYNPVEREFPHVLPTQGKLRWVTLQDVEYNSEKEKYFTIHPDNKWHTYSINMGPEKLWIGDVNNLRIWPAASDGQDGDEFFIRSIEIISVDTFKCNNISCNKYSQYQHPCPWIGDPGICESDEHPENSLFDIEEDSELIVNINDYGNERARLSEIINGNGQEVANAIAKAISKTDIGGYSEVQVEYTDDNTFKIKSGTFHATSTVEVIDNELARYLKFFDDTGTDISEKSSGETPATGYEPYSSFRAKTFQVYSLFDKSETTGFKFNPFLYSIEGGRRDWQSSSMGILSKGVGVQADDENTNQIIREYFKVNNAGKTIIDYNHPFNASGRIKNIQVMCTLDNQDEPGISKGETGRISAELSGAKVMIFRPKRDGTLTVVEEFDIPDRQRNGDRIWSVVQEAVSLDVDTFVNKGDLLGVYNANLYIGKSFSGTEVDARYFQVSGKASGNFDPGKLNGDGSAGLLIYARSDETQNRLVIEIDLQRRYNIADVIIKGEPESESIEYNYARCLDINWTVDTFGLYHTTEHDTIINPNHYVYRRPNTAYGVNRLNDGIYNVPDGLAMDDYYITYDWAGSGPTYIAEAGPGVVPTNPRYFWVNGDEEWLAIWLHAQWFMTNMEVIGFEEDPIAFNLNFPLNKDKVIYKSKIYFKEKFNFRSFALSTYLGPYNNNGNADVRTHQLIPGYNYIWLDGNKYGPELPNYNQVAEYLFQNPCNAKPEFVATSDVTYEWDPILSDAIRDFGGGSGYFIYQTGEISNYEEWDVARRVDWNIITHEFDPITCKGFRLYTDFHKSTKICEFEVYGTASDVGSSLPGGISMTYSDYNDVLWDTEPSEISTGVAEIFIGDTPRYFNLVFQPVNTTKYTDIQLNIKEDDLYIGDKGCEYIHYIEHSKSGGSNQAKVLNIENIYERPYDLYVDINAARLTEDGPVFYSKLDSNDSVDSPLIGPDAVYRKEFDYPLLNADYNCAINCEVYGLQNLIDGKSAYYLYNEFLDWQEFGTLSHGTNVNFNNIQSTSYTVLNLPTYWRSRYWKFGFVCPYEQMNVREIKCFYEGEEVLPARFGYENRSNPYVGSLTEAPHLGNDSITGSYYRVYGDERIIIDLGSQKSIDQIVFFHDSLDDYSDECGVDSVTRVFLPYAEAQYSSEINDYSYYEHEVQKIGTGDIYGDESDFVSTVSIEGTITYGGTSLSDWVVNDGNHSTISGAEATTSGIGYWYIELNHDYNGRDYDYNTLSYFFDDHKDNFGYITITQLVTCEFKFHVKFTEFATDTDYAVGFGFIDNRGFWDFGLDTTCRYAIGVSAFFDKKNDRIGLAYNRLQRFWYESYSQNSDRYGTEVSYQSSAGLSTGVDYYCKVALENISTGLFRLQVWTDSFDGATEIVNKTITVSPSHFVRFFRFAVYSPQESYRSDQLYETNKTKFYLYESEFNYEIRTPKDLFGEPSIYIGGGYDNYLNIPAAFGFSLPSLSHTIDFYFMLDKIPNNGETYFIAEDVSPSKDWRFYITGIRNPQTTYYSNYWTEDNVTYVFDSRNQYFTYEDCLNTHEWYHLAILERYESTWRRRIFLNGKSLTWSNVSHSSTAYMQDIRLFRNFQGWITNFRISSYPDNTTGARPTDGQHGDFIYPTELYQRLLNMNVWTSDDDLVYGDYVNTDLWAQVEGIYYDDNNVFSSTYDTFFAIDLDHRRDIDIVRSYGSSDKLDFNLTKNILYSPDDVDDPAQVEFIYDVETNDDFTGVNGTKPDSVMWTWEAEDADSIYIYGNKLRMELDLSGEQHVSLYTNYHLIENFDIRVDYSIVDQGTTEWTAFLEALVTDGADNITYGYRIRRRYSGGSNIYDFYEYNYSNDTEVVRISESTSDMSGKLRLVRRTNIIYAYHWQAGEWRLLYQKISASTRDVQIRVHTYSAGSNATVDWDNYTTHIGRPINVTNSNQDARWVALRLLNGDGTSRVIRKIGIYPDLTDYIAPAGGNYNHGWDSLGPAVTAYSTGANLALDATISGSSYMIGMGPENANSGVISDDFFSAWGSDDSSTQWLLLDFGTQKTFYRIKVYPGYSEEDDRYMINNYQIQTSDDGSSFTTIFNISSNSSFERTHDLTTPVTARYVRMYITAYETEYRLLREPLSGDYVHFRGAVLRELEVYEYYGYPVISSEDYPILAINLKDRFFLEGHSIIGIDAEDTSTDWSNSDSNFAYSNSTLQDPKKISFSSFDEDPGYEQWAVVKMNTATNYNSGPHYLKHVKIESEEMANSVEYFWWWDSDISNISNSYVPTELSVSALTIDYPASSSLDHIRLREGTNFGKDSRMAYRDGIGFRMYIDDIDNLDLSEGYFYLSGQDGTTRANDIEYRWYWSTYSGTDALQTGWNRPFFRFKTADEVIYTEIEDQDAVVDPRMAEYMLMGTIGLKIKGKGNPIKIYLDGFVVQRNRFNDYSRFDHGLYLAGRDYLTCPIGEIDMNAGTIEFWLRPDYYFNSADVFMRFKVRSLFHMGNTANDVFGMCFTSKGLNIYYGNIEEGIEVMVVEGLTIANALDNLYHFAVVFSNNGRNLDADNSTVKLFINNYNMATSYTTWELNEGKSFTFTLGGKPPLAVIESNNTLEVGGVDGVISNLILYNYCKTDFSSSLVNIDDEERAGRLLTPDKFIEISKDNVTFYKVGDPELPFFFPLVPAGTSVPLYIKSVVPKGLSGDESRTSGVVVSWDVGV